MADVISKEMRSAVMAAVKSKGTNPEIVVRRMLFAQGYRYRLHVRDLPGTPDIVLQKHKTAIQVRGCFWHSHTDCRHATKPASNTDYWIPKLRANAVRDKANDRKLTQAGWRVIVIWECETKDQVSLQALLSEI